MKAKKTKNKKTIKEYKKTLLLVVTGAKENS